MEAARVTREGSLDEARGRTAPSFLKKNATVWTTAVTTTAAATATTVTASTGEPQKWDAAFAKLTPEGGGKKKKKKEHLKCRWEIDSLEVPQNTQTTMVITLATAIMATATTAAAMRFR